MAAALATVLAACSQPPAKPSPTHLSAETVAPAAAGAIPPLVQAAPALPKPQPATRPETYSVVVNNVRVQDLLFALARDARINVDIHPGIAGSVTLNAIDQTLPALLERISKQVDMRYELDGPNLLVMRDSPFLRTYKVDFVSATRNVKMQSQSSTQFGGAAVAGAAGGSSGGGTGSTATIDLASNHQLWETVVQNIRDVLRDAPGTSAPAAPGAAAAVSPQDAAAVIGNRESGVLFVRASARQHERVREFLDSVLANVRRQVLIEATIAEVQLNNEYQQGIDWQRLRTGATATGRPAFGTGQSGTEFNQLSQNPATPAGVSTQAFLIGGALTSQNLNVAIRLLESFGQVRVLSSPKLSVLNNQTALLRVTRDIVYFTVTPSQAPVTITSGGAGAPIVPVAFTTTPNVAAEGFMMSVLPQINEADTIVLNVRPTIRRKVKDVPDPNPGLQSPNLIPEFETREMDSVLRMQSGQTAVLGGLMQDSVENIEDGIPGLTQIPFIRDLFSQQKKINRKTELVIFLRAIVIRDASIEGDYQAFRELLPGNDFLRKPNPGNPGRAQQPAPQSSN
ncbi:MAG TPA: type II and III secretion system protein [Burkholderiales bacterium]